MNKYIVLNPTNPKSTIGGIAVFEVVNAKPKLVVNLFGLKFVSPTLVVDDLVNVRQFDIAPGYSEIDLDPGLVFANDLVLGLFEGQKLVASGSSIGFETAEQKERLVVALEKKGALSHFMSLANKVCKKQEKKQDTFFEEVEFLLFELFAQGVPDFSISKLIPNSKWVKLFLKKDVIGVGIVEQDGKIFGVGLAVPVFAKGQSHPFVDSTFTFFPQNKNLPNGFGYYIVIQDAKSGRVQKL